MKNLMILLLCSLVSLKLCGKPEIPIAKETPLPFILSGTIEGLHDSDSLALFLFSPDFITMREHRHLPEKKFVAPVTNGHFSFVIPGIVQPQYFMLGTNAALTTESHPVLKYYLAEAGDSIYMYIKKDSAHFEGRGAEKFQCKYSLDTSYHNLVFRTSSLFPMNISLMRNTLNSFKKFEMIRNKQLGLLRTFKEMIPEKTYQIMYTDIVGKCQYNALRYMEFCLFFNYYKEMAFDSLKQMEKEYLKEPKEMLDENKALSTEYVRYLFKKAQVDMMVDRRKDGYYFNYFKRMKEGLLRDKLMTMNILDGYKYLKNTDSLVHEALSLVENDAYKRAIAQLHEKQGGGGKAFDFSLYNVKGNEVHLHDFAGKVIFLDFWYRGCVPCVHYFKDAISRAEAVYKDNPDVIFISIAIEKDRDAWLKALKSGKYTHPESPWNLYTGPEGGAHPLVNYYAISACPKPMLIGRKGKVITANATDLGHGTSPDPKRLIEAIADALKD